MWRGQNSDIEGKVWTNLRQVEKLDKSRTTIRQILDIIWTWTKVWQNLALRGSTKICTLPHPRCLYEVGWFLPSFHINDGIQLVATIVTSGWILWDHHVQDAPMNLSIGVSTRIAQLLHVPHKPNADEMLLSSILPPTATRCSRILLFSSSLPTCRPLNYRPQITQNRVLHGLRNSNVA